MFLCYFINLFIIFIFVFYFVIINEIKSLLLLTRITIHSSITMSIINELKLLSFLLFETWRDVVCKNQDVIKI